MVDNIKIDKPLPPLSSTKRVNPMGHRQNNNHQNQFKETFKKRQKKKKTKEDPMHVRISGRGVAASRGQHTRHAVTNQKLTEFPHKKIIDIRV
jgi:hypothetical protein